LWRPGARVLKGKPAGLLLIPPTRSPNHEGQDRAAVVTEFVVDANGTVQAPSIYRALLRNRAQLAYPSVGAWLEGRSAAPEKVAGSQDLQGQLKLQDEAAQLLRSQRVRNGALNFDRLESHAEVDASGAVSNFAASQKTRANDLIEDFMIAANEVMARTLQAAGRSSIRRVVKTPEMFERYLTDPIDTKTRVTGWLPLTDKIYNNNQNNSPIARQFLSGSLKPSATNTKKEFHTSYPYTQPPKANYNLYSPDNIMQNSAVLTNLLYPPFTYYDVNDGKYVSFFADSWTLK